MARCDFCYQRIEPGTGKRYVQKDGKVLDFCSRRCEKNLLILHRKPLETRWTLRAQQAKRQAGKSGKAA